MAVDPIAIVLYVATGLLAGFGFGVGWERRRWEEREHAETMARIARIGEQIEQHNADVSGVPAVGLAERLRTILHGIDMTETEDEAGWWETSGGAEFGAAKLAEVLAAVGVPVVGQQSKPPTDADRVA